LTFAIPLLGSSFSFFDNECALPSVVALRALVLRPRLVSFVNRSGGMDWCSSVLHFWDFLLDVALAVLRTVFVGPFVATSLFLVQGFVDFICFFFWVLFFVSVSWDPGVSYGFDRLWLGAVVQNYVFSLEAGVVLRCGGLGCFGMVCKKCSV